MTAPLPPLDLAARALEYVELPTGAVVERFYSNAFAPIHFDRGASGRMNAPDASYGAADLSGAFAETFLRTPGRTLLPLDLVERKSRVRLRLKRALRLVRFFGPGLARLGATAEVTHGGLPYDAPQAWSKALHAVGLDGVAYRARHDDDAICYAFFDRSEPAIEEESRDLDLDQDWFWTLAEAYGIGLAPPGP